MNHQNTTWKSISFTKTATQNCTICLRCLNSIFLKTIILISIIFCNTTAYSSEKKIVDKKIYKQKYLQNKTNVNLFNYANALYLNMEYKKAYKVYRQVIKKRSKLANAARYYMALCLIKLKRKKLAKIRLKKLLKKKISEKLRAEIKRKISEISSLPKKIKKKYIKRKRFSAFAEGRFNYNSNPGLDSDNELEFDENSDPEDFEYEGNLGLGYWFVDTLNFDMRLLGSFNYKTYKEREEFTSLFGSIKVPTAVFKGSYRFRFTPSYLQELNEEGSILSTYGGNLEVSKKYSYGVNSIGLNYNISSPSSEDFNYLEGNLSSVYFFSVNQFKKFGFTLFTEYYNNSYIDETRDESNKGYQIATDVSYRLTRKLTIDASVRYKTKNYEETNIFFDDGSKTFQLQLARKDKLSQFSIGGRYTINRYLELQTTISQTENKSTFDSIYTDLGDKNYNLFEGKIGLAFFF